MEGANDNELIWIEKPIFWVVIFIVVLAICISYFIILHQLAFDPLKKGVFGDAFGALTSLFTGMAFIGVIFSIVLQRRDLRASITEMKSSAKAQNKQAEILALNIRMEALKSELEYKCTLMDHSSMMLQIYNPRGDKHDVGKFRSYEVLWTKTNDEIVEILNRIQSLQVETVEASGG